MKDKVSSRRNVTWRVLLIVTAALLFHTATAESDPLDPRNFSSVGSLVDSLPSLGSQVTFSTDTLTATQEFTGGDPLAAPLSRTFHGVTQTQQFGGPDIAVFTFDTVNLTDSSDNFRVIGSRPLAILSKSDIRIDHPINISGGSRMTIPTPIDQGTSPCGPPPCFTPNTGGPGGGAGGIGSAGQGLGGGKANTGAGVNGDFFGGGGGFGGRGGDGTGSGTGGAQYGDLGVALQGGSGGGGVGTSPDSNIGGGGGGGAIEIGAVGKVNVSSIAANGGNGSTIAPMFGTGTRFAGGGGSGGGVILHGNSIAFGNISATGGGQVPVNENAGPAFSAASGSGGIVALFPSVYTLGDDVAFGNVNVRPNSQRAYLAPDFTIVPAGSTLEFAPLGVNLIKGLRLFPSAMDVRGTLNVTGDWIPQPDDHLHQYCIGGCVDGPGNIGATAGGVINVNGKLTIANGSLFLFNGTVNTTQGIELRYPRQLTSVANDKITGPFLNQGLVHGPTTPGFFLKFFGDVSGPGSYDGNIEFAAGFSPGNSPALVTLENVKFDPTAILNIEIGGRTAGSDFDQLLISGEADFGGTLNIRFINGFLPEAGDRFEFLQFGSSTGAFTSFFIPDVAGFHFSPLVNGKELDLVAEPVPEPSAFWLLVTGIAGLLGWRHMVVRAMAFPSPHPARFWSRRVLRPRPS